LYGDQFRSPGRDDRQDRPDPQRAPWEAGHYAPANDDVKVAGAPNTAPPGFYDAGVYETTSYDEPAAYEPTAYDEPAANEAPAYDQPGAYGPGAPEGNATAAYDMGTPYAAATPYEVGDPYAAGATSAMPPYAGGGDMPPAGSDFEGMRRKPHASNKRMIKFAAVAAAVAVVGGGGVAWAVSGGGSSSGKTDASQQTQAQVPAPAPLTDAQRKDAEDKRRKELKKRASRAARDQISRPRLLAKGTPPPPPPKKSPAAAGTAGDPVPAGDAQKIARGLLPGFGWSPSSQFGCLVNLWDKESHWNTHAANPSGAYGIPQALPGSKMAGAGPDWQNNATTQIKWGLGYIKSRYSTPCGAWAHSESSGWY
jgi:hypothetical protein